MSEKYFTEAIYAHVLALKT